MDRPLAPPARAAALVVALTAAASLGAQVVVSLGLTGAMGATLWALAGYFTILTTLLVAGVFGAMAIAGRGVSAGALGGLTLWILIVGVVYHLLLAGLHAPVGLDWWSNLGLHSAVPAFTLLWWLAFAPKRPLGVRHVALWQLWPLAYVAYALVRGSLTGAYPYPFVDVAALGYGGVALNGLGLLAAFSASGFALAGLGRLLSR